RVDTGLSIRTKLPLPSSCQPTVRIPNSYRPGAVKAQFACAWVPGNAQKASVGLPPESASEAELMPSAVSIQTLMVEPYSYNEKSPGPEKFTSSKAMCSIGIVATTRGSSAINLANVPVGV